MERGEKVVLTGANGIGKSTLLNRLIGDDCAMVSDIAGTTRDTIEATTTIDGIRFRFIDTAGIRETDDRLEMMGIERTKNAISKAHIILHLCSVDNPEFEQIDITDNQHYIRVINKIDKLTSSNDTADTSALYISAKEGVGIETLRERLRSTVDTSMLNSGSVVVSNMRHYAALRDALSSLNDARRALHSGTPTDLLSEDVRSILLHLGTITGEVTSDDILHSIFSNFCIGK